MSAATEVRERPILFSGPMVRALLDGSKTQTRRVVTQRTALDWLAPGMFAPAYVADPGNHLSPYGYAGDRLWVRETWARVGYPERTVYRADPADDAQWSPAADFRWRPSIHMPRALSRIALEVTAVRVERVREISEADAVAEGVAAYAEAYMATGNPLELTPVEQYEYLWNALNASRGYGWDVNPWVWVLEFRRVTP